MMKKILIYIDSMQPAGGIERVVSILANNWALKYKVNILVKSGTESFYFIDHRVNIESINVKFNLNMSSKISRIKSKFLSIFISFNKLRRYIKNFSPDFIYTSNPTNAIEICIVNLFVSFKHIISEHGSRFGYNKFYKILKKIFYPLAFKLSVPTKLDNQFYLVEKFPSVYIPHPSTFFPNVKSDLNSKNIISIGRLTRDKGHIDLLKIWNDLIKNNLVNEWKLTIVGKGEERNKLIEFINNNSLNGSVSILDPIKEINSIYLKASIFAFTSYFEGFGMVLLEAMSFGIPCISFDCPSGPADIINDSKNGFLIKNRNTQTYKEKLLQLIKNDKLRYEFGNNALNKAKNWPNQKIFDSWDSIFNL